MKRNGQQGGWAARAHADRATGTYTYAADGVSLGDFASWTLSGTDTSKLRSETINSYDDQGRVYLTQQYSVSQTSGYSSSDPFLSTNYYYDHRGDLVATSLPGGVWQKSSYNGAGEDVQDSTTDGGAISGHTNDWSDAQNENYDIVLEQTDTTDDADGNPVLVVDRQRYDNDPATSSSGEGNLTGPNGSSNTASRDSYTVNWYDADDRLTDSADLGNNGAVAYSFASATPGYAVSSQATSTSPSSTTLADAALTQPSGSFVGDTILVTAGTDAGQSATVTAFSGGTLTFSPGFSSDADATSTFTVTPQPLPPPHSALGAASSGSTTTLTDGTRTEPSGYFVGYELSITSGTGAGQSATITGYNGATGQFTFAALTTAPAAGSMYTVTPMLTGTSTSSGSATTLVDSSLTQPAGSLIGWDLALTSGTYSGAILTVTGYNASTGTVTFSPSLGGSVASGTSYKLIEPALVTHANYNAAGLVGSTIDPRGIATENSYDMLGEQTSEIDAYTSGSVTADTNQTTDYTFDADGDELAQTAVESTGNNQTTQYDYGVSGSGVLNSNDLLAETQLPNLSTGAAGTTSGTEQTQTYNRQGEETGFTDQDGNVHQYAIDVLGRETADTVSTLGTGVNGAVRRLGYAYNDDGLLGEATSYSNTSGTTVVNQEEDVYNGLQQLTAQYQSPNGAVGSTGTGEVQYSYNLMADGQNNSKLRATIYPDGRILDTDYSSNQEPVTGIAVSGSTATVTTAVADGLSTGASVTIAGASHSALDGTFTITVTSSTTFYYTFSGSAATDSSSDITETPVSLDSTISRPDGLQDQAGSAAGTVLQGYTYLGLSTIVQENDGNGTALTYITQTPTPTPTPTPSPTPPPTTIDSGDDRYDGLDRFGRVVYQNWYTTNTPTPTQTQGDQYGYDADGDVLYDDVVGQGSTAAGFSQLYHASSTTAGDNNGGYDPLGRETNFLQGTLTQSGNNSYSSAPLDTISNANINMASDSDDTYTLDAVGNWTSSATGAGTGTSTAPTLTSTSRTNNSQNEDTGVGSATLTFDNNGNTTKDQAGNTFAYDAWDRPIVATLSGGGSITYSYLPGDNVASRAACPGVTVDSYYSTDMQVLEDDVPSSCCGGCGGCCGGCGGSPTVQSQYVWGLEYVNQMVERDDDSSSGSLGISGSGLGRRIYPEQDANFNVRTLTSNTGTVLEHINYDSYGNAVVLTSAYGSPSAFGSDTYNWVYGFQGGRYDPSTGLYHFGARYYSPVLGRWMEQDPAGYVNGSDLYASEGDGPAGRVDPMGTFFSYLVTMSEDQNRQDAQRIGNAIGGRTGSVVTWILNRSITTVDRVAVDLDPLRQAIGTPIETTCHAYKDYQAERAAGYSWYASGATAYLKNAPLFSLVWHTQETIYGQGVGGVTDGVQFSTGTRISDGIDEASSIASLIIAGFAAAPEAPATGSASLDEAVATSLSRCFPAGTQVQMADDGAESVGPRAAIAGPQPARRDWDESYLRALGACIIVGGAGYYLIWDHRRRRFLAMAKEMLDAVKAIELPLNPAPMH